MILDLLADVRRGKSVLTEIQRNALKIGYRMLEKHKNMTE